MGGGISHTEIVCRVACSKSHIFTHMKNLMQNISLSDIFEIQDANDVLFFLRNTTQNIIHHLDRFSSTHLNEVFKLT